MDGSYFLKNKLPSADDTAKADLCPRSTWLNRFFHFLSSVTFCQLIMINFHVFSFSHQILMQTTSSGLSSVATVADSASIPAQVGLNVFNSVKVQKINKSKCILITHFIFFFVPPRFWTWEFLFPIWLKKMSMLEYETRLWMELI